MKNRVKHIRNAGILILAGFICHLLYIHQVNNEKIYAGKISNKLRNKIMSINESHDQIAGYLKNNETLHFGRLNDIKVDYTYIYKNEDLVYWSNEAFSPERNIPDFSEGYQFIDSEDRKYIGIQNRIQSGDLYHVITLIPLYLQYDISNEFLESGYNPDYFQSSEIIIHREGNYIPIYGPDNTTLFYVEFLPGYVSGYHWFPILIFILMVTGLIWLVGLIFNLAQDMVRLNSVWKGVVFLLGSLIFIRAGMLLIRFPFNYLNFDLFNSRYYASSVINPSLGDLFINMAFLSVFIVFAFINYSHKEVIKLLITRSGLKKHISGFILVIFFFFSVYIIYKLLYSLSTHSQWSLDISQGIFLSNFQWFSYTIFIMSVVILVLISYVLNRLLQRLYKNKFPQILVIILTAFIVFAGIGFLFDQNLIYLSAITVAFIFFSYLIRINLIFKQFSYKTFVYILAVFIISSVAGTHAIEKVRKDEQQIRIERFGEQLAQENDPLTEYFLAEANEKIQNDVFIRNRLFSPFGSKEIIKEKIRRIYLNNYLDRYEVNIFLFNSSGDPIISSESVSADYHTFKERLGRERFKTDYDNIYFYLFEQPVLLKRYLDFIKITNQHNTVSGYIILDLKLKKIIPTKVYPRLLLDDRFSTTYFEDVYDYALYKNYNLVNSSGNFNYDRNFDANLLEESRIYTQGVKYNGYHHFGFRPDEQKVYIISSPVHSWINTFANFSFLFIILSFCLMVLLMVYAIYFNIKGTELNYVTRIQLYLNLAFFIPLIVISLSTLTRSTSDYRRELEQEYIKSTESTGNNLTGYLQSFILNELTFEELSSKLSELADFSELDINIFRVLQNPGRLLVSTQPLVYDKNILSELIDPMAMERILEEGEKSLIVEESFGELDYKTAYVNMRSPNDGRLIGILSIPFFGSQQAIEKNLTGLVVNILSIFTIIFIGFLILSYVVSSYLTFPLKFLTDRLRRTTLTGSNEPLQYQSQDEIGQLVAEYNNMLLKLEESKKALTRSEKEAAWREMAKQVAHEIKNPLTPMKLTLQHMKMRVNGDNDEKAKYEKAINSLLHNIETLSDIATTFSNYAQMPVPEKERFDIAGLLRQTVNIYINSEENIDLVMDVPEQPVEVEGDPGWIGRTISNLIINGIQAVDKGLKPKIKISLEKTDPAKILIKVKDNGKGIPHDIRDKIFMPNFSTKYSGSGIGLAIAKRAIDHAGGKIWFETLINKGTTFYIELPVIS